MGVDAVSIFIGDSSRRVVMLDPNADSCKRESGRVTATGRSSSVRLPHSHRRMRRDDEWQSRSQLAAHHGPVDAPSMSRRFAVP
jgi:hypothetical protein